MHRFTILGAAALLLPATAISQDALGILNKTNTSFTSRGSSTAANGGNPTVIFNRLDKETYAGFGFNPASPGMREVTGLEFTLQDQVANTQETFSIELYQESTSTPDFPDVSAPLGAAGPFNYPIGTSTGPSAFTFTQNFATPVLVPNGSDMFVAVSVPQPLVGAWPTDGLSCHALSGASSTTFTTFDLAGPGMPAAPGGYGGYYVATPLAGPAYSPARQFRIQPIVTGATGVAGTITNQTSATLSNTPPGTSSQFSGLYPDAISPPLNAGRVDDVAGRFFKTGSPDTTPVVFLIDFGTFGPEIPLANFLAGSSGVACLNPATMASVGLGFTTSNEAFVTLPIPAAARPVLSGLPILHQAVAFDVVNFVAIANGCTRQLL